MGQSVRWHQFLINFYLSLSFALPGYCIEWVKDPTRSNSENPLHCKDQFAAKLFSRAMVKVLTQCPIVNPQAL